MLTLSRREGESIILFLQDGNTIEIRLSEISGTQARLSFDAPSDIQIYREELVESEHSN